MFRPIFHSNCPFAPFFLNTPAGQKSLVRTIGHIQRAVQQYNRSKRLNEEKTGFILFNYIKYESGDKGIVAYMAYHVDDSTDIWPVQIVEYEE